MMKLKVGLVGVSDPSFIGNYKKRFTDSTEELKKLSKELGFDLFVVNETVTNENDARKAVKACEDNNVEFLLLQTTTVSTGVSAPIFANIKNARLGIWAIPEEAFDGPSPYNSFICMTFYTGIIGNYMTEEDIQFKWFYGNAKDKLFLDRFKTTVFALTALKNLCKSNVALIGGVPQGFGDLCFDERNIKKRFNGIKLNQYQEYAEIKERALSYSSKAVAKTVNDFIEEANEVDSICNSYIEQNARIYLAFKAFQKENGYDAIAINCTHKIQQDFSANVCSVIAKLNDDGIVTSCEGDVLGAISMLLMKYLSGNETSLMDFPQFDENDDSILMWHCGPTSKCFANEKGFTLKASYSGVPIIRDMAFKAGHITIARISEDTERFLLADGEVIDGKNGFLGCRGWVGNLRLNREKISALDFVNTVLEQKLEHHYPIAMGDLTKQINEIASWKRMGFVKKIPYQDFMQNKDL